MSGEERALWVAPRAIEATSAEVLATWAGSLAEAGATALLLERVEIDGVAVDAFAVAGGLPILTDVELGVVVDASESGRSATALGRELISLTLLRGRAILGLRGEAAPAVGGIVRRMLEAGPVAPATEAELAAQGAPFDFENRPKLEDPSRATVVALEEPDLHLDASALATCTLPTVVEARLHVGLEEGEIVRLS